MTEQNKRLVKRFYEEVVGTGRADKLSDFISSDYAVVHERTRQVVGIEGARDHIVGVRNTYPDMTLEVAQQVAEGEWVVSKVFMRGTHAGEWLGMKPTGKTVEMSAVNIDRVVAGRIVEHGGAANLFEPLLGIGAIRIVGRD